MEPYSGMKARFEHRPSSAGNHLHQRQRTRGEVTAKQAKLIELEKVTTATRRGLLSIHMGREAGLGMTVQYKIIVAKY